MNCLDLSFLWGYLSICRIIIFVFRNCSYFISIQNLLYSFFIFIKKALKLTSHIFVLIVPIIFWCHRQNVIFNILIEINHLNMSSLLTTYR